jgi:hypothetical protein
MAVELIANADELLKSVLGFWRFVGSPAYRASVRTRWAKRQGVAQLATVGEVLGATFFGVIMPVVAAYVAVRALGA